MKWKGILIEANRKLFSQLLTRNRNAFALPVCLSLKPYPTEVAIVSIYIHQILNSKIFSISYNFRFHLLKIITTDLNHPNIVNVQCFPLYSILLAVGRTNVDYFSVETEENESQILTNIPWHRVNIKVNYNIDITIVKYSVPHFLRKMLENNSNFLYR